MVATPSAAVRSAGTVEWMPVRLVMMATVWRPTPAPAPVLPPVAVTVFVAVICKLVKKGTRPVMTGIRSIRTAASTTALCFVAVMALWSQVLRLATTATRFRPIRA